MRIVGLALGVLLAFPWNLAFGIDTPVVFVSRQIPQRGSIYWDVPNDLPGVGPHSRFRVAAPGKLLVLEPNGSLRTLVDGGAPSSSTLHLVDVSAPDVSYDGNLIVFAGYPVAGLSSVEARQPAKSPGHWRLYIINADGTGLRQLTLSDMHADYSQFGSAASSLRAYDDTDPAWLPDGRIVFSSTRWPAIAQYSGVRTTNLFVVNPDGSGLHRITADRNGADRPVVDPVTGKIVYARWWRNHRFATDDMSTVTDPAGGYRRKDGLTTDRNSHVGGADHLWRNQWHAAAVNPDGTGLVQWTGPHHANDASHFYGGSFTPGGHLLANYFPMANMTEAAGFGGIRLYDRGPASYASILGITHLTLNHVHAASPTSYGIYAGSYATDAIALDDATLVVSRADGIQQDYGLYLTTSNGQVLTTLYDNPGTSELRAKLLKPRPLPPRIEDTVTATASLLPPAAQGPYAADGTFVFDALNVYFNGPVDTIETSAPAVGSADKIRFFLDIQQTSSGSFPNLDWPILLGETTVNPDGSVREPNAPANLPLFEQIRSPEGTVPLTPGGPGGAAHVAGMNFGRPGQVARCVGCHAGHTLIQVPVNDEDAKWTNLAPGADVRVSSSRNPDRNRGLVDRQVIKGGTSRYWTSTSGQTAGQWVELVFPVPITIRNVRLYNPPTGGEANSTLQIRDTTVRLFSSPGEQQATAVGQTGSLSVTGSDVLFQEVTARVVRVEIGSVSGTFYSANLASLAEIEVIARVGSEPVSPADPSIGSIGCDVNADGQVSVSDVQSLIRQSLGLAPCRHDLNRDGLCDVADTQRVINAALGLGCSFI